MTRVSKQLDAYQHQTRTTAALKRYAAGGHAQGPGQDVRYVVVDHDADGRARVRLAHKSGTGYDVPFYADRLRRAAESVLSPCGWQVDNIKTELKSDHATRLGQFINNE